MYLSHKGASITRQPTNECRAAPKYQILWRWTFLIVVLGTKWRTKKGIIFEKRHWMWGRKVKKHFIMTDEDFLWRHTLAAYLPSEFYLRAGDQTSQRAWCWFESQPFHNDDNMLLHSSRMVLTTFLTKKEQFQSHFRILKIS